LRQKKTLKLPKLIGHRGVKDLCPENTIESISKAFEIGLTYVEVDVKISKDEIPILLHDDKLDRTTNGTGLAINHDYNEIKKLDAGKFFYNKDTNIFVPKIKRYFRFMYI
jgi:Glycerophosphoryl diester phosphodiesterase